MRSRDERFIVSYNGELYNSPALREQLEAEGVAFRGSSDTEVLVEAFAAWGRDATLTKAEGMFALALWDRDERELTLARDRFGEKPLYYALHGGTLLFGSELRCLLAYPSFNPRLDAGAVALLLRYKYIPAPHAIYAGVQKVRPGTFVSCRRGSRALSENTYWSARDLARSAQTKTFDGSEAEAVDTLEKLLAESVSQKLLSDVPLGAFLSGGIDSSVVVALMQRASAKPVRTFTIGFEDPQFDESAAARGVAAHLGTDHTEVTITADQMLGIVPRLPTIYDEPFADSSQIPTFLVSEVARRDVTVALSGDGGDELFGGYPRYTLAGRVWRTRRLVPRMAVRPTSWLARSASRRQIDGYIPRVIRDRLPSTVRNRSVASVLEAAADALEAESRELLYRRVLSDWDPPGAAVPMATEPVTAVTGQREWLPHSSFADHMMFVDSVSYLPDDILVKVDRASMAVSLETRLPLLDPRVFEFAWRLPPRLRLAGPLPKWALRQVAYRHVPRDLLDRPKQGFGVPLAEWLRGPLREWAEDLLTPQALASSGVLASEAIRLRWAQHVARERNWQHCLWSVLMFQAWLQGRPAVSSR